MYSTRQQLRSFIIQPKTTEQVLALVQRMRVVSLHDKELARLIEDLEPHLPKMEAVESP